MKSEQERLEAVIGDPRLYPEQQMLLKGWARHHQAFKPEQQLLDCAYTIREFGLFINKPYENAQPEDVAKFIEFKRYTKESLTGNRVREVGVETERLYHYRLHHLYRYILNHVRPEINPELAYQPRKVVLIPQKSLEEQSRARVIALLKNEIMPRNTIEEQHATQEELKRKYAHRLLDEENLKILNSFYHYKFTSGIIESHAGYDSKLSFIKRLGLFLKARSKTYKDATREDIQEFLSEVQKGITAKRPNHKGGISITYKASILDFYRFVYGMFEEEIPRKYPPVVSWLYQGRKKSHDKVSKEVIPENEIKAMLDACTEIRDKALISLLMDCSARVGELININIKDLLITEVASEGAQFTHTIATVVLRGKTGERTNQLFYSVPYLRLFLLNHPLKDDPNAPLFIATQASRYGQRLSDIGINKIIQRAAMRVGIKRHVHAHLFRHTNLTRMAKFLSESELKIHAGWGSDSLMASTYVHLTQKDVANKILEKYGIVPEEKTEKETLFEIRVCPNTICSYQNPQEAKFCLKCGYPLTLNIALAMAKIKRKEDELQSQILSKNIGNIDLQKSGDMREVMYQILKAEPELVNRLKEIIELARVAENK